MNEEKTLSERLREVQSLIDLKIAGEAAERIDRLEAALLLITIPRVGGGPWASEIARKVMGLENA